MIMYRYFIKPVLLIVLFVFLGSTGIFQSTSHGIENPINLFIVNLKENKGDKAYEGQNYPVAFAAYRKAAEAGSAYSQFMLANMYLGGQSVKKDREKYMYWIRKSADNGYPSANFLLGTAYLFSDPAEAVRCFKKAGRKENSPSMHILGVMYAQGVVVKKSTKEALRWFRLAKAQGFPVKKQLLSQSGIETFYAKSRFSNQSTRLIKEIQQRLTKLAYNPGHADGLYGNKTRAAIQAFQRKIGMEPDGLPNDKVLRALRNSSD